MAGLVGLALAVQKALADEAKAIASLQVENPKLADAEQALAVIAAALASLQILEKEIGMIAMNSLADDTKKVVDNVKKSLPRIVTGAKETVSDLTNAVKDPKKVNKDDVRKAADKLGSKGSVTQQVTQGLKQLTDWKPPKGLSDVNVSGVLSLPAPSLGDNWKGTTVPGTLTVPSPSIHWSKHSMSTSSAAAAAAAGGKGDSDGEGEGEGGGGGGGGAAAGAAAGGKSCWHFESITNMTLPVHEQNLC